MNSDRVLLTGATGFVGGRVLVRLQADGVMPRIVGRREIAGCRSFLRDLQYETDFDEAVQGVDYVIHCAGFSHAFDEADAEVAERHYALNCRATLALAECAARAGVKRFVFCSTVKAGGEPGSGCIDEEFDAPPEGVYGWAKREAELGLLALSQRTGMEVVILRLALIFGPGSRGNVERMFRLVQRGLFPPLPETGNRRSMVYIEDAVDALLLACAHPAAAGRIYIVAHPAACSGRQLFAAMREVCAKPAVRWSVPAWSLRLLGKVGDAFSRLFGRRIPLDSQVVSRLLDSACYRSDRLRTELGWAARYDLRSGLAALMTHPAKGAAVLRGESLHGDDEKTV